MATIVGEIRALLGVIGAALGTRRRRTILLERRGQLDEVFREAFDNLALTRRRFGSEDDPDAPFNWRAWLYGSPLRTRAWRQHRAALTTAVDGGPVVDRALAQRLDALCEELDVAGRFQSDWEARLVDVAARLRDLLERYPRRWWNRLAMTSAPRFELPDIDPQIRTPQSPAELQRRAIERLADAADLRS